MKLLILLLFSPAIFALRNGFNRGKSPGNINDEPFLPIFPDYPYNPKLMKRGLHDLGNGNSNSHRPHHHGHPPVVDGSTGNTYASSSNGPYYPTSYDTIPKGTSPPPPVPHHPPPQPQPHHPPQTHHPLSALIAHHYNPNPYGYHYPNYYYGGSPYYYHPSTTGYYNHLVPLQITPYGHYGLKHLIREIEGVDLFEDADGKFRRPAKGKLGYQKNRVRSSDFAENQYVDGANYIVATQKDLDSESSTHRTPINNPSFNQIDDLDFARAAGLPKATYRLVALKSDLGTDYLSPGSYVKVHQLEQLMRQALQRLLAQNAVQQLNLAQLQAQENQANSQVVSQNQGSPTQPTNYVATGIAKTGLSYVVNPTVITRVSTGQSSSGGNSQLIQNQAVLKNPQKSPPTTSVTIQQVPGIYVPPLFKATNAAAQLAQQNAEYNDYDGESVTIRSSVNYPTQTSVVTAQPTSRTYLYRTTQQTSSDENVSNSYGSKQNVKNHKS